MLGNEVKRVRMGEIPEPSPRETWMALRNSPRYNDFVYLINKLLDKRREEYIEQPASEFNRGRVMALREVAGFLKNGELP